MKFLFDLHSDLTVFKICVVRSWDLAVIIQGGAQNTKTAAADSDSDRRVLYKVTYFSAGLRCTEHYFFMRANSSLSSAIALAHAYALTDS